MLTRRGYGYAADWWSAGILLHELLVGITPFGDDYCFADVMQLLRDRDLDGIFRERLQAKARGGGGGGDEGGGEGGGDESGGDEGGGEKPMLSSLAHDLVRKLLVADADARLGSARGAATAAGSGGAAAAGSDEVRSHGFFRGIEWETLHLKSGAPPFEIVQVHSRAQLAQRRETSLHGSSGGAEVDAIISASSYYDREHDGV